MKSVKLKLMFVCIIVGGLISLTASPASAATIIWQSANTDIYLGLPYSNLEFDNPLTGTEMVKEYAVREWRDASYAPGSPPWYDAWNVNDPVNIDGYYNEIWMRQAGHSIWTTTTVASKTVSVHLYGDDNDGLADIIVDGILVAQLDMGTAAAPQTALIIVKGLSYTTHHIQINDLGVGPSGLGRDVATLGAAALEKHIKWSQPPKPTETDNLYYGWNEISEYDGEQIVADDWLCENDDPVTDIHWWGSFKDWVVGDPPILPESFHITFWTDVPDPNPDDPDTFSHPNDVVWQIKCTNFDYKFVGWDYDPKTNCYEACFLFEQYLTEDEYFYQKPSPDGTPAVYWISIAAVYPDGTIVENPWGWKARPRMFNDDAVQIRIPTNPTVGDKYEEGTPIYWPDPNHSWDMAFELTSIHLEPNIKWEQPPNPQLPGLHCHDSEDAAGNYSYITIADDWKCRGGEVTDLHWYGNYEMDALNQEIRGSGVRYFHLSIHNPLATVACMPQPTEILGFDVPLTAVTVTDTGLLNSENCKIYLYEYDLPEPFPQELGQDYWLDITAFANDAADPPLWRWQEAARSVRPSPYLCGAVTRTEPPVPGPWQTIMWPDDSESDMAFAITSTPLPEMYVKWSQPPEPYKPEAYFGWNELSVYSWEQIAADDWFCDTADPVTDIHWWGSFIGWSCEEPPQMPESFHIAIWTDVPAGVDERFSHPGRVIWETECDNFTSEFVGWDIDPRDIPPYMQIPPEACFKFEQDLPEEEWFYQQPGGNIYWLSIAAKYPAGTEVQHPWGWKTRPRDPNSRAPDDAVRIFDPTAPVLDSVYMNGWPLFWPTEDDSWDLAFELTTKEIPPKPPVPHLKWSQPPIEIDPNNEMPVYCGWDEPSYSAPMVGAPPIMKVVADDYRCIGSMPVTSVHWWGSYLGWDNYILPLQQPDSWLVGFWSNVSAGVVADFSYPETLLWQLHVSADRVKMEMVGRDEFPPNPDIFPETCFQYYVDLKEDEIFWQQDYLEMTQDNTFWVSIVAVYSDTADIMHPWGWKTRPWSWMDDAVTFNIDGDILPGETLHPDIIQPIEYQGESYDVAFELDTDPNYIKWEQPFTGIRHWPHYEDEKSMASMVTTTDVVTKWLQKPDLTDMGVDVDATLDLREFYPAQILADDYKCDTTEAITGINIYGSWWHDDLPLMPEGTPNENWVQFTLSFHRDIPVEHSPTGYSMPGDVIWWRPFNPGEFAVDMVPPPVAPESYYMPCSNIFTPHDHQNVWKYSFSIPESEAFLQQGTEDEPVIYWLDVQAIPQDVQENPEVRFGWKTSIDHWNDDATWTIGREPYNGDWNELRYPPEHPYGGESIDLAFELTTQRTSTEFVIDRLVADDWKCKRRTPVTAAVWWGSYIGYEYKACYDEYMPPPVKPDYFQLSIWTDVPADADSTVPFSHPNEVIWKYNAYDYDEVLVGYDKHPHTPGTDPLGREPVFRYSVRLPEDEWFKQRDVNDIYWFSVVAVYDEDRPNYDWGWTNHSHVFNDDAVAGYYDPAVGEWDWIELLDQTENSEDMSFILFTDPKECVSCADYNADSIVNFIDYSDFADDWNWSGMPGGYNKSDLNCNGVVDNNDLNIFTMQWLSSCP